MIPLVLIGFLAQPRTNGVLPADLDLAMRSQSVFRNTDHDFLSVNGLHLDTDGHLLGRTDDVGTELTN
jgi:hypothetical protein